MSKKTISFEVWWNKNKEELYNGPCSKGDMETAWNAALEVAAREFKNSRCECADTIDGKMADLHSECENCWTADQILAFKTDE